MSLKTNCGHASSDGDAKLGVRFAVAPEEHAQEKQVREQLVGFFKGGASSVRSVVAFSFRSAMTMLAADCGR